MEEQEFVADPKQLRAEAEKEPRRRGLEDYKDTILLLKDEKGFSFREIAAWLQERGLKTDHNAVWRAYCKAAPVTPSASRSEQIERLELNREYESAMPWEKAP